jgi:hypothetical protein
MSSLPPPLDFCLAKVDISWADFVWALQRQIFTWKDAIAFAKFRIAQTPDANELEQELARLEKVNAGRVNSLVRDLAELALSQQVNEKKWLYLHLAWTYQQRELIADPLGEVERIYSDFGYPEEIEGFVRYMPPKGGWDAKRHTQEENKNRMVELWKKYLDRGG